MTCQEVQEQEGKLESQENVQKQLTQIKEQLKKNLITKEEMFEVREIIIKELAKTNQELSKTILANSVSVLAEEIAEFLSDCGSVFESLSTQAKKLEKMGQGIHVQSRQLSNHVTDLMIHSQKIEQISAETEKTLEKAHRLIKQDASEVSRIVQGSKQIVTWSMMGIAVLIAVLVGMGASYFVISNNPPTALSSYQITAMMRGDEILKAEREELLEAREQKRSAKPLTIE